MTGQEKVKLILKRLYPLYPNPRTALQYTNPLELLIATMLAAQTTDKLVNTITPYLFKKYTTPQDYVNVSFDELNSDIAKVNFHNNKAKSIQAMCQVLADKFNSDVPDNMEDLDSLPGVARKTANVVLGNVFKKAEGIVVDTHVTRLSKKLGLTDKTDPVKIEQDLMKIIPYENWIDFSHLLINHGRDKCIARPHSCEGCPLKEICPEYK